MIFITMFGAVPIQCLARPLRLRSRQVSPSKPTLLRRSILNLSKDGLPEWINEPAALTSALCTRSPPIPHRLDCAYPQETNGSYRQRLRSLCHGGASTWLNTGTIHQLSTDFPIPWFRTDTQLGRPRYFDCSQAACHTRTRSCSSGHADIPPS